MYPLSNPRGIFSLCICSFKINDQQRYTFLSEEQQHLLMVQNVFYLGLTLQVYQQIRIARFYLSFSFIGECLC